jgi:hypothetical protein
MQSLTVQLGERSYPILIGRGLIDQSALVLPYLKRKKVVVVTNTTIAPLYLARFANGLRECGVAVIESILPDGEQYKEWQTLNQIFDTLLQERCERSTTLIALGGGVIGDMGGFAAACYQRGMPFIQVPTTLLAQVDSSVGGKTAINHPLGKNMIGAFYQPQLVLADTDTLSTLPDRELSAGLAEVIKYGLIRDLSFLAWLETNIERLRARDTEALAYAIHRSCANKAEVVAADERETGERALLNAQRIPARPRPDRPFHGVSPPRIQDPGLRQSRRRPVSHPPDAQHRGGADRAFRARTLRLNDDLAEAIALAHDLGHTPFRPRRAGCAQRMHAGHGGFEHNLQSLRIVDRLEERYGAFDGLNLMFETREGILKHCSPARRARAGRPR